MICNLGDPMSLRHPVVVVFPNQSTVVSPNEADAVRQPSCIAVCCSVLQCVAACCSVLQCVALSVCCSVMQLYLATSEGLWCSVLYSVLQCVA